MYGRVFIYYLWLSISTFSKKKKKDEYSINNKTSSKYIYNLNFENKSKHVLTNYSETGF